MSILTEHKHLIINN